MSFVTTHSELRVERHRENYIEHQPGYVPAMVQRERQVQNLVRITRHMIDRFCISAQREVVDQEEIPEYVLITLGCVRRYRRLALQFRRTHQVGWSQHVQQSTISQS